MKTAAYLCAAALLAAPCLAAADGFSYTSVQVAAGHAGMDTLDGGTAYRLSGDLALGPYLFLDASAARTDYGTLQPAPGLIVIGGYSDLVQRSEQFGFGAHMSLSAAADLVGRLNAARFSLSSAPYGTAQPPFFSLPYTVSKSGYDLGVGLRTHVTPSLELDAFLDHDSAGLDFNFGQLGRTAPPTSENVLSAGLRWRVYGNLDLGLDYIAEGFDDERSTLLTATWNF